LRDQPSLLQKAVPIKPAVVCIQNLWKSTRHSTQNLTQNETKSRKSWGQRSERYCNIYVQHLHYKTRKTFFNHKIF